ncbi:hypothetical protein GCM10027064_25350 [Microbacterium petrolearium]
MSRSGSGAGAHADAGVRLSGRVLQTKPLLAGEGVSYGYRFRATRDTRVALVTGGYAQGVVRALGGHATVMIRGRELPIVGRVAMDVCVVEIGDAEVEAGDEAVFLGPGHPGALAAWARATGLTEDELAAGVAPRAGAPRTEVELRVDLGRLRRNVRAVRERMLPAELMVIVKDDAYGLGVDAVVPAAADEGASWFGAIDIPSALRAKRLRPAARVFAWATATDEDAARALEAGLELGVGDTDYLQRVAALAGGRGAPAVVHLKIDTGLHRNGIRPEAWPDAVALAARLEAEGSIRVAGVWTHIAEASDAEDDASRAAFERAVAQAREAGLAPEVRHLAASAAAWHRPEFRYDLVRVGAFCYGVRSADGPELEGIEPVATLVARVTSVTDDRVTAGVGATDGLLSTLAGRVRVATPAGPRALLTVGPASIEIEGWDGAAVGDEVRIFGAPADGVPSATDLAEAIDTVGEELLLRVSPLVPRVYGD